MSGALMQNACHNNNRTYFLFYITDYIAGITKSRIYRLPRHRVFVPANRATFPKSASMFALVSPANGA